MKNYIILLLLIGLPVLSTAQYEYSVGTSAETLAERLQGEGVTILNPEIRCWDSAYGMYDGLGDLGIDNGIVLSNTYMDRIFNLYTNDYYERAATNWIRHLTTDSFIMNSYFRPLLDSWDMPEHFFTLSSCAIGMDVVPHGNELQLPYVFADMLLDSVGPFYLFYGGRNWIAPPNATWACHCLPMTNIIGVFLSGNGYGDTTNFAIYPQPEAYGENVPVNRYTLRLDPELFDTVCSDYTYYNPETDTMLWGGTPRIAFLKYNTDGYRDPNINFPGYTPVMETKMMVNPCDTYRLVVAVGWLTSECNSPPHSGSAMFLGKLSSPGGDSCMSMGIRPEELEPRGLKIYPNPLTAQSQLDISGYADEIISVRLTDILGRKIWALQNVRLEELNRDIGEVIEALSSGTYFLQVRSNGTTQTIKCSKK